MFNYYCLYLLLLLLFAHNLKIFKRPQGQVESSR